MRGDEPGKMGNLTIIITMITTRGQICPTAFANRYMCVRAGTERKLPNPRADLCRGKRASWGGSRAPPPHPCIVFPTSFCDRNISIVVTERGNGTTMLGAGCCLLAVGYHTILAANSPTLSLTNERPEGTALGFAGFWWKRCGYPQ